MDEWWQCEVCRSLNRLGTAECFHCGTARLIPPIPGTRVFGPDPKPAVSSGPAGSRSRLAEPPPPESGDAAREVHR
jgi:hypothetical protein